MRMPPQHRNGEKDEKNPNYSLENFYETTLWLITERSAHTYVSLMVLKSIIFRKL